MLAAYIHEPIDPPDPIAALKFRVEDQVLADEDLNLFPGAVRAYRACKVGNVLGPQSDP